MNLEFLKKYQWKEIYSEQGHVLATYMAMENRTKLMQQSVGTAFSAIIVSFNNNFMTLYWNPEDARRVADFIIQRIATEPGWMGEIGAEIYKRARVLLERAHCLIDIDYTKLSNAELFTLYKSFVDTFVQMRLYSSIPTNAEMDSSAFTHFLQDKLAAYIAPGTSEFNHAFSVLTTPSKHSYLKERDCAMLRLGEQWGKQHFEEALREFTKKYTWTNYTFQGTPISRDEFRQELAQMVVQGVDFNGKLKSLEEEEKKRIKQQSEIIGRFTLGEEVTRLFGYGREFVFLKFFRKGVFAESTYCVEFLLNAIATRLDTTLSLVQGMLFKEVEASLNGKEFNMDVVRQRIKKGWLLSYEGECFDLPVEWEQTVRENIITLKLEKSALVKGETAMSGRAEGVVKIINSLEDMVKMQIGDIMISRMTNPHLFLAMKKAGGIVTDMGGLTCHAAIVARELKKPCVIGTKIATHVFKDGDMVEVDADKGIVRKI